MEKKSILVTIFVAAIVGVISSIITSFFISVPSLGPAPNVNSNSCNADGVCEINSAVISSSNPVTGRGLEVFQGGTFGNLQVGGQVGGGLTVDGTQIVLNSPITSGVVIAGANPTTGRALDVSGGASFGNFQVGAQVGGGIYVDGNQVLIRSPTTVVSLMGATKAYVCVNSAGLLYRGVGRC